MSSEVRRYSRTEVEIITDISVPHADQPRKDEGSFLVLGGGGALVDADVHYPIGCLLLFRFRLPDEPEEICCQGVVCNEVEGRGVGVEFLGVRRQDRDRISMFVAQHMTAA